MPGTKIEFNSNKIARIQGLDEFAALLFPGSREQQKVFLAIFIELKYSKDQFLPFLGRFAKSTVLPLVHWKPSAPRCGGWG